jgi:hypothetical protein
VVGIRRAGDRLVSDPDPIDSYNIAFALEVGEDRPVDIRSPSASPAEGHQLVVKWAMRAGADFTWWRV